MHNAQNLCFVNEGKGTQISEKFRDKFLGDFVYDDDECYLKLGQNTTQEDLDEALWVMKRENQTNSRATTWLDLQLHLAGVDAVSIGMEDHDDPDDIPLSQLVAGMQETSVMSIASNRLKEAIENGTCKRDIDGNTT